VKVLFVHNYYGSEAPSGENHVVEAEMALLKSRGHIIKIFSRYSDEIRAKGFFGAIQGAMATPWNPWMRRQIRLEVNRFRPDVVHIHNTFPLVSPSIFSGIGTRAARVITLHNYRLFCSSAIPVRRGVVCTDCLDTHSSWPAVSHSCYRSSRLATLPLAFGIELHRKLGTWTKHVDGFIALSDFQRSLMVASGLPEDKVRIKPNFYPGRPTVLPWSTRAPYVVFVGRLGQEKGLQTLLRAWRLWDGAPELRLVGDGDLRPDLERMAEGLSVRILGQLTSQKAQAQIAGAQLLILPSECFEGFPMVIREAFAFGTPVAVSELGPLPSIVHHGISGIVFSAANPNSLFNKVRAAWSTPGLLEQLGKGARMAYEAKYSDDVNYKMLMGIYQQAINVSHIKAGG